MILAVDVPVAKSAPEDGTRMALFPPINEQFVKVATELAAKANAAPEP